MRKYDYSFLKHLQVPIVLMDLTNAIVYIRQKEEEFKNTYPDVFTNLMKIAIIQSVKGSNEIEGIVTTDKRIKDIIEGKTDPLNHDEKEILGYKECLDFIHNGYREIKIDEDEILTLHRLLLSHADINYKGSYKTEDNVILERRPDGTRSIRWKPISAKETKENMEQLILAFEEARNDSSINQLVLIPCFILDFLCIHPFRDGNGRMSRLLSLLLLYKNDFDVSRYISFEEQINKDKWAYYESLRRSSISWHENGNDYLPFIENFLKNLYLCYHELDKRFLTLRTKKMPKSKRIEEIVMGALIPISKKEISELLPDISITTIEKTLGQLTKEGKIAKIGTTFNCRYIKR